MGSEVYLQSLEKFGMRLGLERITCLLDQLDNPQDQFESIHIAGTNGKGSVAAILNSILKEAGYKVGLYTSPHILTFCERIKVNAKDISGSDFEKVIQKVKLIADKMDDQPTVFEVLTAAALTYFAAKKVDIAILEVGLGGRFDATNVVDPLISVITQIAADHTEVLGKSLKKIAFEKAGIIKPNRELVVGEVPNAALKEIKAVARQKKAPLFSASAKKIKLLEQSLKGQSLVFEKTKLFLPLLGRHQIDNLAVVLMIIGRLRYQGIKVSRYQVKSGLKKVRWPLRFQVFSKRPLIVLDAAHNLSGIKALTRTLKEVNPDLPIVFYVGMLKRKDHPAMLKELCRVSDRFFVSDFNYPNAAKLSGKELLISKALSVFKKQFKDHLICVTGSIYFVSDFVAKARAS